MTTATGTTGSDTASSIDEGFLRQVEPMRRELTAHCYRMVGSVHDAEDLVQETYLRAWKGYGRFEERSSLRTWMYQIATNTCLTALKGKQKRPLPTGLGQPNSSPNGDLEQRPEVLWLEPLPDTMVWGDTAPTDPADAVVAADSVRLAFVAALQHLTAQQRAVVILCDVLAWKAREAADALEVSVASVNSSLQRARAHLAKTADAGEAALPPEDERAKKLLDDYVAAFEAYDLKRILSLLNEDIVWEMPPFVGWYRGPVDVVNLIDRYCPANGPDDTRIRRAWGNGQPVLALYERDADGVHRAFQLQMLTVTDSGVSHVTCFFDTALFEKFGLPAELEPVA